MFKKVFVLSREEKKRLARFFSLLSTIDKRVRKSVKSPTSKTKQKIKLKGSGFKILTDITGWSGRPPVFSYLSGCISYQSIYL